jgi:hypothetical protein
MDVEEFVLNNCGWVYLRNTDTKNVYKIGRTNTKPPTKRASVDNSVIIILIQSINNLNMETHLKNEFKKHYKIYTGTEYFIANLFDIKKTFNKYFYEYEEMLFKNEKIFKNIEAYVENKAPEDIKNIELKTINEELEDIKKTFESKLEKKKTNLEDNKKDLNIKCDGKFSCEKCLKTFLSNQALQYHLNDKKTKCDEKIKKYGKLYKCDECINTYTKKIFLKYHMIDKHPNKINNKPIINNKPNINTTDNIEYKKLKHKVNLLENYITKLNVENTISPSNNCIDINNSVVDNSVINNNIATNNVVNNNVVDNSVINNNIATNNVTDNNILDNSFIFNIITRKAFDDENTNYIDDKFLMECIKKPFFGLPELISAISFDIEHPENHNIILPNKKIKIYKVFNGIKWFSKSEKWIIENLIKNNIKRIKVMFDTSFKNGNIFYDNDSKLIDSDSLSDILDKAEESFDSNDSASKKLIDSIKYKIIDGLDEIKLHNKSNPITYNNFGKIKELID